MESGSPSGTMRPGMIWMRSRIADIEASKSFTPVSFVVTRVPISFTNMPTSFT
jgi:hypothetical protein